MTIDTLSSPSDVRNTQYASTGRPHLHQIVKLWHRSDVAYLLWKRECDKKHKEPGSLEWVFLLHVDYEATLSIMKEALGNTWHVMTGWPGGNFPVSSEAGKALRGSRPGGEVNRLIAAHQKTFKGKMVDHVVLFDPSLKNGQVWNDHEWLNGPHGRHPAMALHVGGK